MLEVFLRKYTWVANAVLLIAAAWLCARTVNTVVAASIRPRPAVDLSALPAAPPPAAPPSPLEAERVYGLFGQKAPPPPDAEGRYPQAARGKP